MERVVRILLMIWGARVSGLCKWGLQDLALIRGAAMNDVKVQFGAGRAGGRGGEGGGGDSHR